MADEYLTEGHWPEATRKLAEVRALVGEHRRVLSAERPPGDDWCYESYPCSHVGPLTLTLDDGTTLALDLSSVETGLVQAHYFPEVRTHFSHYADGYQEWLNESDEKRAKRPRVASLLSSDDDEL